MKSTLPQVPLQAGGHASLVGPELISLLQAASWSQGIAHSWAPAPLVSTSWVTELEEAVSLYLYSQTGQSSAFLCLIEYAESLLRKSGPSPPTLALLWLNYFSSWL